MLEPGKKILYVASRAPHLQRFHEPYLRALRERYEVKTMAAGEGVDFDVPFEKKIFSPKNLRLIGKIRRILKQERFDCIILNTILAAVTVRLSLRGIKPRPTVLYIVHGFVFSDPPKGFRERLLLLAEKMLRKRTDAYAVMNRADLVAAERHRFGKIRFLHGMGLPELPPPKRDLALRARFLGSEGAFLLTFVGELCKNKNQIFLIRAVKRLREDGVPVRLLLLGEGTSRAELEREVEALALREFVFLPGNVEPVLPYLAASDLYVSASEREGLPFNLLEAMHCGLPILASDVRGQTDLLEKNSLYPLNDMDAFCQKVKEVLNGGKTGSGAVIYPNLDDYRLQTVFAENMEFLTNGGAG